MEGGATEPMIAVLEEVWSSIAEACRGTDPAGWERPTDCPGWTVRDQLSHLIGIERSLLGEEPPPLEKPVPGYVRNPMGEANEAWVAARRARAGDEVLAEFGSVTRRRLQALRSMSPEALDAVGRSPVGRVPYRELLSVRVFDSWVHEQDVRRALGRPGGRGGGGEATTVERIVGTLGYSMVRKARAPEGSAVEWRLAGPSPRRVVVVVEGGRGRQVEKAPGRPDVVVALGTEAFWRLGCGRSAAESELASGAVTLSGDVALGRRVLEMMSIAP